MEAEQPQQQKQQPQLPPHDESDDSESDDDTFSVHSDRAMEVISQRSLPKPHFKKGHFIDVRILRGLSDLFIFWLLHLIGATLVVNFDIQLLFRRVLVLCRDPGDQGGMRWSSFGHASGRCGMTVQVGQPSQAW